MNFFDYFIKYYYHHQYGVTYIITEVVCCLAIALIFNDIKVKDWRSWLVAFTDWLATFVAYLFLSCLVYYIYEITGNIENSGDARFYVWIITTFLHAFMLRGAFKNKLLNFTYSIACSLFIILSINLSGNLGSWLTNKNGAPTSTWNDVTLYLVFILLILAIILFKTISPFKYKYVNPISIILVNLIFIICYLVEVLASFLMEKSNAFSWVLTISIWCICILSYVILYVSVKNYNKTLDLQAQVIKSESEKNQMMLSKIQYEQLHQIRHDIKNQMSTLESLFKSKNYERLNEYFKDLDENVHITIDYVDSSNDIVNAIMNNALAKCKASGITLIHKISVPSELNIKSDKLNSLISNLIDNALEYEIEHQLIDPIDFSMYYNDGNLLITCKNALANDEDIKEIKDLKSKKEGPNHGYGVKIIHSIIKEYDGVYKYSMKNNVITFEGMLCLAEDRQ